MGKSIVKSKLGFMMFTIILAASLSIIVTSGMKELFEIPRPCEGLSSCDEDFSFPSRHAAANFAVFAVFSLFNKNIFYRVFVLGGAVILSYSRILLGAHTAADVVAGAVIGFIIGVLVYYMVKFRHKKTAQRSVFN